MLLGQSLIPKRGGGGTVEAGRGMRPRVVYGFGKIKLACLQGRALGILAPSNTCSASKR